VGTRCFGVFVVGEWGCELLVLLGACGISGLTVYCCVSVDAMSPVASLTGVGLKVMCGRLRVWLHALWGWRFEPVGVVRLVCGRFWDVLLAEGEYCFTFSSRVVGWGQDSSRSPLLVLAGLTGSDVCVSYSPRVGRGGVEVVLVGPSWEKEEGGVFGSGGVAALSSGAFRLVAFIILYASGCPFFPCRCWSSWSSLS